MGLGSTASFQGDRGDLVKKAGFRDRQWSFTPWCGVERQRNTPNSHSHLWHRLFPGIWGVVGVGLVGWEWVWVWEGWKGNIGKRGWAGLKGWGSQGSGCGVRAVGVGRGQGWEGGNGRGGKDGK